MTPTSRVLTLVSLTAASACAVQDGDEQGEHRALQGESSGADLVDAIDAADEPRRDGSDDALALGTASGCEDCRVLNARTVTLPETGRTLRTAKFERRGGEQFAIAIDEDGAMVDEQELLAAERAAVQAHYGKLSPELYELLPSLHPRESMWIWIWTKVPVEYPPKEDLLANPERMRVHEERVDAALADAARPVREALRLLDAEVHDDGRAHPLIRARVPVGSIRRLADLPTVAMVGYDNYPGQPLSCDWPGDPSAPACHTWYGTLRADAAHTYFSTGSGERICVKEGSQPASYALLSVSGIASPSGYSDWHTQGTTGLIKNLDVPNDSVAPDASVYVANWDSFVGTGGVDGWCRANSVRTTNFSWTWSTDTAHAEDATGWAQDWAAKNSPYVLYVAASGDNGGGLGAGSGHHYVMNGNYNGLIVGGSDDRGDTDRSNDLQDPYTGWGNLTTAHGDFELPHVVAPSFGAAIAGTWMNASSGASPMVAGVVALAAARDPGTFAVWPEMKRAVVIATATGRLDQPLLSSLPAGVDRRVGAGLADAFQAADLGNPAAWSPPGGPLNGPGRHGRTLNFATDFDAGNVLKQGYNIYIPGSCSSARLRVVIAWDATAGCNANGESCTGSTIDADLDLQLYPANNIPPTPTGGPVCTSSTYDSSWEICDVPVVCGQEYIAKIKKYATNAPSTYLGVAWYTYPG